MDVMIQSMIEHFTEMDVSGNPALRHLTPDQQREMIDGLLHNLTSYQEELYAATDRIISGCRTFDPSWCRPTHLSSCCTCGCL